MRKLFILPLMLMSPVVCAAQITDVCFTPGGMCADLIVDKIAAAKKSIYIQAYSFTSDVIAKAARQAHKRGVDVVAILDKSQRTARYSSADYLYRSGIRVLIDDKHAIAHNKIMIIDGRIVITGSFNFTSAAQQKNAENVLIIEDSTIATRYSINWAVHAVHSIAYQGKTR